MGENDRKQLYTSLLRGLAREAQNQLCAADQQHDWSPWHRTVLDKGLPLAFVSGDAVVCEEVFRVRSDRHCLNCGKEEML